MLRKIFNTQPNKTASVTDTVPQSAVSAFPSLDGQTRPSLRVAQGHHVGIVRRKNQDVLYTFTATYEGQVPFSDFGLYVVADGMGGHSSGELASATAAQVLAHQLLSLIYIPLLELGTTERDIPVLEILEASLQAANLSVVSKLPDGGTTVSCALVLNDRLFIGHVGDSRVYSIMNGEMTQLTEDHSLVQRLQELGQITAEEAAVHPQRNVLYRAVGQGEGLEIDVFEAPLNEGEQLLICSDGLWSMIDDAQMLDIVNTSDSMQDACDRLVDSANMAGGNDNITVLMVEAARLLPKPDVNDADTRIDETTPA